MTPTAALNDAITLLIAYSAEITTAQANPATGHVDDADARQDIAHIGDTVAGLRSLMYALAAPASQITDRAVNELIAAAFRDEPATAVRVQDVVEQVLALAAPAQQPTDWREAVLDALASTGGDMPATATPAEIVRAVLDANVQIALDPRVSDAAPAQQPEHPPLPVPRKPDENGAGWFTAGQMRAYVDADRAQRFTAPSVSDRNLDV